ncbi:hypothetical protein PF66_00025 [Pseudomonas asplenii]|uniref:Uncharacterized protein n=1 Tax=Pseudomonas asplenii TaxID=53407 RepID=A0A0N0E630_9PSED|nr:hypothetical protein PF66_00025 [Pseudomonas fuscovaginae]KPA99631.1 hypothetical protein PF70_00206 [Pseudomonas fuscovaginae]
MSNFQIGLTVLIGISVFGVVTFYLDFWRETRTQKERE